MTGRTEAACLENLKMCISETVAMRHPNPMKHIACMLVAVANPNFQETLDPTAEYVQRHNLQVRLTAVLAQAGYREGQPEPPDLLNRLYEQLLAGADAPPAAAHREADLEHLKVTLKSELRAELKAELLAELRDGKLGAAAEAHTAVVQQKPVTLEPITYDDAFVAIGGESELAKHTEASQQLQARVSDAELDAELQRVLLRDYTERTGFSTKLINQPFVRDLDALYEQANAIYSSYAKCIQELAAKLGAKALVPPLKGEARARMKAIFKYRDVASEGVAWYRLTDLVRATLEFDDLASLYAGLQAVVDHFGEGVQELNDR